MANCINTKHIIDEKYNKLKIGYSIEDIYNYILEINDSFVIVDLNNVYFIKCKKKLKEKGYNVISVNIDKEEDIRNFCVNSNNKTAIFINCQKDINKYKDIIDDFCLFLLNNLNKESDIFWEFVLDNNFTNFDESKLKEILNKENKNYIVTYFVKSVNKFTDKYAKQNAIAMFDDISLRF